MVTYILHFSDAPTVTSVADPFQKNLGPKVPLMLLKNSQLRCRGSPNKWGTETGNHWDLFRDFLEIVGLEFAQTGIYIPSGNVGKWSVNSIGLDLQRAPFAPIQPTDSDMCQLNNVIPWGKSWTLSPVIGFSLRSTQIHILEMLHSYSVRDEVIPSVSSCHFSCTEILAIVLYTTNGAVPEWC